MQNLSVPLLAVVVITKQDGDAGVLRRSHADTPAGNPADTPALSCGKPVVKHFTTNASARVRHHQLAEISAQRDSSGSEMFNQHCVNLFGKELNVTDTLRLQL